MISDLAIERLCEIDGDWIGGTLLYFARGHFDAQSFVDAVNGEHEPSNPIRIEQVKHCYRRQCPIRAIDGGWTLYPARKGERGAFAVTAVEVLDD